MSTQPLIVIVTANSTDREALVRSLNNDQQRVVGAETPEDALSYLDDSVNLVISELHSGDFSGLDLLRRWKSREPRTPFVLITESDDVSSAVEAMKLGAADCVVKPVETERLRTIVKKILKSGNTNGRMHEESGDKTGASHTSGIDIPPGTSLEDLERAAVEQALAQHHGNRTHAAKTLGISVRTLQRKLKAWGMPVVGAQNHQNENRSPHFLLPTRNDSRPYSTHAH